DLPQVENLTQEELERIFGAGLQTFQPTFEALEAREMLDAGFRPPLLPPLQPQNLVNSAMTQQFSSTQFKQSQATAGPVTFRFADQSGLANGSFYYGIYGTDPNTGKIVGFNPQSGKYEQLATGVRHDLPMYQLGSTVTIPKAPIDSARMIITVGKQSITVH